MSYSHPYDGRSEGCAPIPWILIILGILWLTGAMP